MWSNDDPVDLVCNTCPFDWLALVVARPGILSCESIDVVGSGEAQDDGFGSKDYFGPTTYAIWAWPARGHQGAPICPVSHREPKSVRLASSICGVSFWVAVFKVSKSQRFLGVVNEEHRDHAPFQKSLLSTPRGEPRHLIKAESEKIAAATAAITPTIIQHWSLVAFHFSQSSICPRVTVTLSSWMGTARVVPL
jgi:hypothetical protein